MGGSVERLRVVAAELELARLLLKKVLESFRAGDIVVKGRAVGVLQRIKNYVSEDGR